MSNKKRCDGCLYYEKTDGEKYGYCHRFPPVLEDTGDEIGWAFPVVSADHWCGEWKVRGRIALDVVGTEK